MRTTVLLVGLAAALAAAPAATQSASSGSVDYTNLVKSHDIGSPQSGNAVDQYLRRQGLQDLGNTGAAGKGTDLGRARPAKKDELVAGAAINDKTGVMIAKIEQIDPDGVVVAVGMAKVKVPADAFGHNKAGLLLDMTKAQFDQVVAQANAGH